MLPATPSDNLRRYPFLFLLAGLLTGIGMEALFAGGWWLAGALMSAAASVYLCLLGRSRNVESLFKFAPYHAVWIFLASVALGVAAMTFHKPYEVSEGEMIKAPLAVGMVQNSSVGSESSRLVVEISALCDASGRVLTTPRNLRVAIDSERDCPVGSRIIFLQKFRAVDEELRIHNRNRVNYLLSQGIKYRQWLAGNEVVIHPSEGSSLSVAEKIRESLLVRLEKSRLSRSTQALVSALALGERSGLTDADLESFRLSGISHILALSGMHVGIMAALLSFLLLPVAAMGWHRRRWVMVIILLWGYVFITGMQVASVRACLMLTVCLGGLLFQRKSSPLNALGAAAFFILAVNPLDIASPGFQLSFVAVLLLILAIDLNPVARLRHPLGWKIAQGIIMSLTAWSGTFALTAFHFHTLPLSSLVPNFVIILVMPVYVSVALMDIVLLSIGFEVEHIQILLERGSRLLMSLADAFSASDDVIRGVWVHGLVPLFSVAALVCLIQWGGKKMSPGVPGTGVEAGCRRDKRWLIAGVASSVAVMGVIFFVPVEKPGDGFIVRHGGGERIEIYTSGQLTCYEPPAGSVGVHDVGGKAVGWVNARTDYLPEVQYLLLGQGYSGALPADTACVVVVMPTLPDYERAKIAGHCRAHRIPHHDIVADGPLEVLAERP